MNTHHDIDSRSLHLHEAIAKKLDENLELLDGVREWAAASEHPALVEWSELLAQEWPAIRKMMLDPGDDGQRRRQSSPFTGILTPKERWKLYRESRPT